MTSHALTPSAGVSHAIEWLARAGYGYAARGVVYVMVGGLALLSAAGMGGSTQDPKGALETLMESPGGWIALLVIGVGLIGYAVWRFLQAALDTDDHGKDLKGIATRGGLLVSAITHMFLAIWAIQRAIGWATDSSQGSSEENWTAWLMGQPFGRWLVAAVGVAVVGAGVAQFVKGWKEKFRDRLDLHDDLGRKLVPVCKAGLIARGVSFGIIGSFFLYAAWTYDPGQAGGLEQAFNTIRSVAFGQILLVLMSLGLLSFAVYSFVQARYRRINATGG